MKPVVFYRLKPVTLESQPVQENGVQPPARWVSQAPDRSDVGDLTNGLHQNREAWLEELAAVAGVDGGKLFPVFSCGGDNPLPEGVQDLRGQIDGERGDLYAVHYPGESAGDIQQGVAAPAGKVAYFLVTWSTFLAFRGSLADYATMAKWTEGGEPIPALANLDAYLDEWGKRYGRPLADGEADHFGQLVEDYWDKWEKDGRGQVEVATPKPTGGVKVDMVIIDDPLDPDAPAIPPVPFVPDPLDIMPDVPPPALPLDGDGDTTAPDPKPLDIPKAKKDKKPKKDK